MTKPTISVIIPAGSEERAKSLNALIEDVHRQTVGPVELVVIRGVSPNGRARNEGVMRTKGDFLVFLDDDVRLGHDDVLAVLVRALADSAIGLVGTAQQLPLSSSRFQRAAARQIPRSQCNVVDSMVDSDMVTTQCCAIRRDLLAQLGGFHDKILRGVDPELRDRVRQAGYRIVVAPNVWHYHPMPSSWRTLLRIAWRNGYSSAFAQRHFPETVLFNPEGHVTTFNARPTLRSRVGRRVRELVTRVVCGEAVGVAYDLAYAIGVFYCVLTSPESQ